MYVSPNVITVITGVTSSMQWTHRDMLTLVARWSGEIHGLTPAAACLHRHLKPHHLQLQLAMSVGARHV